MASSQIPSISPPFEPYFLSPLDHAVIPRPMSCFISFELDTPEKGVTVLDAAISSLLQGLPFLTGDIIPTHHHERTVYQLQPPTSESLENSPLFQTRSFPSLYLSNPRSTGEVRFSFDNAYQQAFFPIPLDFSQSGPQPILRFQANVLADGIVLSIMFHHLAIDGGGLQSIVMYLASCCRAVSYGSANVRLGTNPEKERKARDSIFRLASTSDPAGSRGAYEDIRPAQSYGAPMEMNTSRRLTFSADRIERLRMACLVLASENMDKESSLPVRLSGNDIVTVLIWLRAAKAEYPSDKADIPPLVFPVNVRPLLQPPLPMTYMGNGIVAAQTLADTTTTSLLNTSMNQQDHKPTKDDISLLLHSALKVRDSVTNIDATFARRVAASVHHGQTLAMPFNPGNICISSLRVMPVYSLDFGPVLERCETCETTNRSMPNAAWILPARAADKEGVRRAPWEVRITMQSDAMERLLQDRLIQWASGEGEKAKL